MSIDSYLFLTGSICHFIAHINRFTAFFPFALCIIWFRTSIFSVSKFPVISIIFVLVDSGANSDIGQTMRVRETFLPRYPFSKYKIYMYTMQSYTVRKRMVWIYTDSSPAKVKSMNSDGHLSGKCCRLSHHLNRGGCRSPNSGTKRKSSMKFKKIYINRYTKLTS